MQILSDYVQTTVSRKAANKEIDEQSPHLILDSSGRPPSLMKFEQTVEAKRPQPLDCTGAKGIGKVAARKAQMAWATYLKSKGHPVDEKTGEVVVDLGGGVKMEFVVIPAGKYIMGSSAAEKKLVKDQDKDATWVEEEVEHEVVIKEPFYMAKYEVTQQQYAKIMGKNPSAFSAEGGEKEKVKDINTDMFPVEGISWNAAQACLKKMHEDIRLPKGLGDYKYRLPSEAMWEYACRAGTRTHYHFGDSLNGTQANCDSNNPFPEGTPRGANMGRPVAVDSKDYAANSWGLTHMHGNVWEWCEDYYGPYDMVKESNAHGPLQSTDVENTRQRAVRSGPWYGPARDTRSAYRGVNNSDGADDGSGFRVCLMLD
jgi:formylglycine-generating enzyme required for sulfatase activity